MATFYWENSGEDIILDIKKLSYTGRTQLVQTVLFGVQAYWAQLLLLPAQVLKTIDAFCRSYLW